MRIEIENFLPAQVLDCGQCFRWRRIESSGSDDIGINSSNGIGDISGISNNYTGIAHGRRLEVSLEGSEGSGGSTLILKNITEEEYNTIWRDYFDLSRDYGALKQLYSSDAALKAATEFSPGLRLMRQDPWETLISFILSQNSNIPRIKGMIERLCENFGRLLPCGTGYSFPEATDIASLSEGDLAGIKSGYRADYIIDAARRVSDGRLDLKELQNKPTDDVRKALLEVRGVGPKVADCVLLYGFGRIECFPMDVWMKRVMERYYPGGFPNEFADTAGIAQQFLFHYIRNDS